MSKLLYIIIFSLLSNSALGYEFRSLISTQGALIALDRQTQEQQQQQQQQKEELEEPEPKRVPVLIFFTSNNCMYCPEVKRNLNNPYIRELLKKYRYYEVDTSQYPKFTHDRRVVSLPTLIVGSELKEVGKDFEEEKRHVGGISISALVRFLD